MKGTRNTIEGVCPQCGGVFPLRGNSVGHHHCVEPEENRRMVWKGRVLPEAVIEAAVGLPIGRARSRPN
jgi:hypothetical protein